MTKRFGIAIFATLAAVLGGLALFIFLGVYDVGADAPHWDVTRKVIEIVRDRAIEVRAKAIQPPDLEDAQLVLKGAGQYASMCVNCHLAPGRWIRKSDPAFTPSPQSLRAPVRSESGILGDETRSEDERYAGVGTRT